MRTDTDQQDQQEERICLRAGCTEIFTVRHAAARRRYCTEMCIHKASTERRRAKLQAGRTVAHKRSGETLWAKRVRLAGSAMSGRSEL